MEPSSEWWGGIYPPRRMQSVAIFWRFGQNLGVSGSLQVTVMSSWWWKNASWLGGRSPRTSPSLSHFISKDNPNHPNKKIATPPTWFKPWPFHPLSWRSLYSPKWVRGHVFQPSAIPQKKGHIFRRNCHRKSAEHRAKLIRLGHGDLAERYICLGLWRHLCNATTLGRGSLVGIGAQRMDVNVWFPGKFTGLRVFSQTKRKTWG